MPPKTAWRRLNLFALDAFVECKNTIFSFNLLVFYPLIEKKFITTSHVPILEFIPCLLDNPSPC
jgi:hypothetical protein